MLDEGYDAVGPNLRHHTHLGYYPHFSGTYFWTTHEYVRTLKKDWLVETQNIFLEEFWIGSGKNSKLGSTFECGMEHAYLSETKIDKYIKVSEEARGINLVLVPSVVRKPVFSVFPEEERLAQLLETIKSAKEKIPESYIVVLEGGEKNKEDAASMIGAGADCVFSYELEKNGKTLQNWNRSKSYGEMTLFLQFFTSNHFKEIQKGIKSISKVGGRGRLTEKFSFQDNENCVINYDHKVWSGKGACSGRYWKIPISKYEHLHKQLNLLYENFDSVIDIEHGFYEYNVVPLEDIEPGTPTGYFLIGATNNIAEEN